VLIKLTHIILVWLPVYVGKTAANTAVDTDSQCTNAASHVDSSQVKSSNGVSEPVGEWCEATTPEGYVYYWNTVTKGETMLLLTLAFSYELFHHRP